MPIAFEIQQGLPCVFTNLPNLLFTAQLCLLTFYAAAFSLGKYEKWRNINLVKLHANSIALLEKT